MSDLPMLGEGGNSVYTGPSSPTQPYYPETRANSQYGVQNLTILRQAVLRRTLIHCPFSKAAKILPHRYYEHTSYTSATQGMMPAQLSPPSQLAIRAAPYRTLSSPSAAGTTSMRAADQPVICRRSSS